MIIFARVGKIPSHTHTDTHFLPIFSSGRTDIKSSTFWAILLGLKHTTAADSAENRRHKLRGALFLVQKELFLWTKIYFAMMIILREKNSAECLVTFCWARRVTKVWTHFSLFWQYGYVTMHWTYVRHWFGVVVDAISIYSDSKKSDYTLLIYEKKQQILWMFAMG